MSLEWGAATRNASVASLDAGPQTAYPNGPAWWSDWIEWLLPWPLRFDTKLPSITPGRHQHPLNVWKDKPGVHISVDPSLRNIEYLDYVGNLPIPFLSYMHEYLEVFRRAGYVDDVNLFGFPYDFRYPAWQLAWKRFMSVVEGAATVSHDDGEKRTIRKVVIVSHSLGSLNLSYFFNKVAAPEWKEKYILCWVSLNGAFGGAPKSVRALLFGTHDWTPGVSDAVMRRFYRGMGALYTVLPNPVVFGVDSELVVSTGPGTGNTSRKKLGLLEWNSGGGTSPAEPPEEDFSAERLLKAQPASELFTLRNWTALVPDNVTQRVQQTQQRTMPYLLKDPGVPVACIWCELPGNSTEISYIIGPTNTRRDPIRIMGPGDGTIPSASASWCTRWRSTIWAESFADYDHLGLMKSRQAGTHILNLVEHILPARVLDTKET